MPPYSVPGAIVVNMSLSLIWSTAESLCLAEWLNELSFLDHGYSYGDVALKLSNDYGYQQ